VSGHFRRRGAALELHLDAFEVQLLRDLQAMVVEALDHADIADPALHRLFPTAVADDAMADADLRAMVFDSLMEGRRAGLDALVEILDRGDRGSKGVRVVLHDDEPALVLGVLNDVRLALGARIGVEQLERDALDDVDEARVQGLAIIDHLAWIQEQLIAEVDPASTVHYEETRDLE